MFDDNKFGFLETFQIFLGHKWVWGILSHLVHNVKLQSHGFVGRFVNISDKTTLQAPVYYTSIYCLSTSNL